MPFASSGEVVKGMDVFQQNLIRSLEFFSSHQLAQQFPKLLPCFKTKENRESFWSAVTQVRSESGISNFLSNS